MNDGAATVRPREHAARWRLWCLVGAVVVVLLALVPPLSRLARDSEYGAAIQFSLLAIVLPALVTVGAPWRLLGLAGNGSPDMPPRIVDRVADHRRRHRELPWSLAFIAADLGVVVAWHAPGAVAAVAQHGWLVPLEGADPARLRARPLARAGDIAAAGSPLGIPASGGARRPSSCGPSGSSPTSSACPTTTSTGTSTTSPAA